MQQEKYIPGVCNIGPQERKLRKMAGWIGVAAFLMLLVCFRLMAFPKWTSFILFFPAAIGSVGFLQDYFHFCVNFGLRGLRNMDKATFQTDTVDQAEYRRMDRQKAWKIISMGLGVSLAVTALAYFF